MSFALRARWVATWAVGVAAADGERPANEPLGLSADGSRAALACPGGRVEVRHVASGGLIRQHELPWPAFATAALADARVLAVGAGLAELAVSGETEVFALPGPAALAVRASADGRWAAVRDMAGGVALWDVTRRAVAWQRPGQALALAFSADGARLAIAEPGGVAVHATTDGACLASHDQPVEPGAAIDLDGDRLLTVAGADAGRIEVRTLDGAVVGTAATGLRELRLLDVGRDGRYALGCTDGSRRMAVIDLEHGGLLDMVTLEAGPGLAAAIPADGRSFLVATPSEVVRYAIRPARPATPA